MQTINGYDWENLRTFLAVARAGSARAAAEELGVHYTSLTRRLKSFEKQMGVRLFDRGSFGYILTKHGEAILPYVERIEDETYAVERLIVGADTAVRGRLKISMPRMIAAVTLMEDLVEFQHKFPDIDLEIDPSYSFADLLKREADVAVRVSNNPPNHLVGTKVGTYYDCVFASPDYLRKHDPYDPKSGCTWVGWPNSNFLKEAIASGPFPHFPQRGGYPDELLQLKATRAGAGLGMLPCTYGDQEPGVVRVPGVEPIKRLDIWLLTHPDLRRTARVRAILDHLHQVMRARRELIAGKLPG